MTDKANGTVTADTIRIERVPDGTDIEVLDKVNGTVVADAIRIERVQSASASDSMPSIQSPRMTQSDSHASADQALRMPAIFGVAAGWEGRKSKAARRNTLLDDGTRDALFGIDRSDWLLELPNEIRDP